MSSFILLNDMIRQRAIEAIRLAPERSKITIREGDGRTLDQNAKLWPMLTDLSQQVEYHGHRLTPKRWKDVLTASLEGELLIVPTINNDRLVMLGEPTSSMSKKKFSELIELIYAFGAEKEVVWSTPEHMEKEHAEAKRYLARAA